MFVQRKYQRAKTIYSTRLTTVRDAQKLNITQRKFPLTFPLSAESRVKGSVYKEHKS